MYWLETEMKKGTKITEKTAAGKLEDIQKYIFFTKFFCKIRIIFTLFIVNREDTLFKMLSFNTISAVGANAAIVHYNTDEGFDSTLTIDKVYLLDAGAQYEYILFYFIFICQLEPDNTFYC